MSARQPLEIEAADGVTLAVTIFEPEGSWSGMVVINSALAMPRQFYRRIAEWFADRGYACLTYDYRGIGESAPDDLVGYEASVTDWVEGDMRAMLDWASARPETDRLFVLGHSLGGQVVGLLGDRTDIDAMATFAAQTGYWRRQYPGQRWRMFVGMHLGVPAVTHLLGYLPWSQIFGGEDVPKAAALQWAGWCRHPDYLLGDPTLANRDNFDRFSAPIVAYSFEDDHWGWREAVDWMMEQYTAARVERVHLVPGEVGLESIGHFGFFRAEAAFLWDDLLERLEAV